MVISIIETDANAQFLTNTYWKDQRFEYSGGNLIYMGCHIEQDAATSDSNWYVWKLTWSVGNITRKQLAKGAWDNRATLF